LVSVRRQQPAMLQAFRPLTLSVRPLCECSNHLYKSSLIGFRNFLLDKNGFAPQGPVAGNGVAWSMQHQQRRWKNLLKTNRSAAKRFRVKGSGSIMR